MFFWGNLLNFGSGKSRVHADVCVKCGKFRMLEGNEARFRVANAVLSTVEPRNTAIQRVMKTWP